MRQYSYAHGASTCVGLMICAGCSKHICAEPFRYYEKAEGFVTHCRVCSVNDPGWDIIDAAEAKREKLTAEYIADCRKFYAKWQVSDFTDMIEAAPDDTTPAKGGAE